MANIISLELEIELIERYLEIEDLRFEEGIKYTLVIEPGLVPSTVHIPVMMLQPFIENAIWHGLLTKPGEKNLELRFSLFDEKYVKCIIEDNGTGRKMQEESDIKNKSLATLFVRQRLDLLNKIHGFDCILTIDDKPNAQGTVVTLLLPILNKP